MPLRIQRPIGHRLMGLRVRADHLINGINLHAPAATRIGHDRVFVARLINQYRLSRLGKEVNDGCAGQAQGLCVYCDFETMVSPVLFKGEIRNKDLRLGWAPLACNSTRPVRSRKKNFSGKAKYSCNSR